MYYSIQPTQYKGQIGSTRQAATPYRSAGGLYQALAGASTYRSPCRLNQSLMSLTACEEYKPLGVCLKFSYVSATQNYPEKQRQPNSNGLLVSFQFYSTDLSACSRSLLRMRNCQSMASTGSPCLCNIRFTCEHHALGIILNYLKSHNMYIRSLFTCKCKRQREQLAATSFQKATASD